jgi:hypothetical protein
MASSFWVDEMATCFVVRHGAADPSLRVAPQVAASIYYVLPRVADRLFGYTEWAYRLPSLLALGLALFFIARIAARLVHPAAAWFAIFCCLAFRPFDYQAADARPYALGACVVCAALWFLLRWLDTGRWRHAALFAASAALVCQVHLVFWPMYLVFACVAVVRLARRRTPATWRQAFSVFAVQAASAAMLLLPALALLREAGAHVITARPSLGDLSGVLKLGFVATVYASSAVLAWWRRWRVSRPAAGALLLVLSWWLLHPLCLFAFSRLTGMSVFVTRYLSVALPGAALAATLAAALFLPADKWRPASLALGAGVLLFMGEWGRGWPPHHNSNWRAAARMLRASSLPAGLPVLCPSPFIEARPPVWRPDYPIESFLYSHLLVYRIPGKLYPFPYDRSPETEPAALQLWRDTLSTAPAFVVYGIGPAVWRWRDWFRALAQPAGWHDRVLGTFGDVYVVRFEPSPVHQPAVVPP